MTIWTAVLVAVFVVAVNLAVEAVRVWWTRPAPVVAPPPTEQDAAIDAAILAGMRKCGVQLEPLTADRDLGHKWPEVLFHATRAMGYTTRTVADLREWLR